LQFTWQDVLNKMNFDHRKRLWRRIFNLSANLGQSDKTLSTNARLAIGNDEAAKIMIHRCRLGQWNNPHYFELNIIAENVLLRLF
jgi:hypothetical protein